jgi:hypothetical protein
MAILTELIAGVRSNLDEDTAAYWANSEIVRWLNKGKDFLWTRIVQADEDYALVYSDDSIISDTSSYDLPKNLKKLRRVEQIFPSDTSRTPVPWYPISLNEKGEYATTPLLASSVGGTNNNRYFHKAGQIQAVPTPGASQAGTGNLRIWYVPRLGDLHDGTASAGATRTITLPSSASNGTVSRRDDEYIGLLIEITGGTGVGQVKRITDYNGTTRVATVDSDWNTVPDSTSTYSMLPPIPEEYHECMVIYATIRAYKKDEADATQFETEFTRLTNQLVESIENWQTQEPSYVKYVDDNY